MLVKGDLIKVTQPVSTLTMGEVCEIIDVDDKGVISFKFGNGMHKGCMSYNEFEEHFLKVEKAEPASVDAAVIKRLMDNADIKVDTVFDKCTVVTARFENGFVITESSSCLDPMNYDEEEGYKYCLARIEMKLWEFEAYRLQCEIYSNK